MFFNSMERSTTTRSGIGSQFRAVGKERAMDQRWTSEDELTDFHGGVVIGDQPDLLGRGLCLCHCDSRVL